MGPKSLITVSECTDLVSTWRSEGQSIALVPTMGALHAGHISLIKKAKEQADRVVVSTFVNPSQFGPSEDFAKYPRTPAEDMKQLKAEKVDAVFSPTANEVYPVGFQTWVSNDHLSNILCGISRPGHFRGVCSVVLKFVNIAQADFCVLGKKDFQQFKIIGRMIEDLNIRVKLIATDTLRSDTGLALSSRNSGLSPFEVEIAPNIFLALNKVMQNILQGVKALDRLSEIFSSHLAQYPEIEIEYFEILNLKDLSAFPSEVDSDAVALTAVKIGSVRLIDNIEIKVG